MALYLLHKTFEGEPIGGFSDTGESYYVPEFEHRQGSGQAMFETKGVGLPWSAFVDKTARYTNFHDWWEGLNSDNPLPEAVEAARTQFFSDRDAAIEHDR